MKNQLAIAKQLRAFLLGLGMLCILTGASSAAEKSLQSGDSFPDLSTFSLEGKMPAELRGKIVLVDFWASWCGPCKDSFPAMDELQARFGSKGLVVIAVNLDDESATMNEFLKKHPVSFCVVRDAKKKLVSTVNIKSMPCSFLLTPAGKVSVVHKGFHGQETRLQYAKEIEALISANLASQ